MKSFIPALLFLFLAMSLPLFAGEPDDDKMRIAILDLKADGIAERTAKTVSNMLRSELIKMGRFVVVERAQMDEILREQGFQQTGCTDSSCAVEMGKLLSARKILVGEVSPLGEAIMITVRIVDVEKGVSEFAGSQKAETESTLDAAVSQTAAELAFQMDGGKIESATYSPGGQAGRGGAGGGTDWGYYLRGLVPGWGQFYAGENLKGWIFGGVFAASAGFTAWTAINYYSAKDDYVDKKSGTEAEFDDVFDKYESGALLFNIAIGVVSAVYAANWVDLIFFTSPYSAAKNAYLKERERDISFSFAFKPSGPSLFLGEPGFSISLSKRI